jgi:hypothetical protein
MMDEVMRWHFTPEAGGAWVSSHIYDRDVAALKAERDEALGERERERLRAQRAEEADWNARAQRDRLAATVERFKTAGACELGGENPNLGEYMDHWERRCLKAEATIERVKALPSFRAWNCYGDEIVGGAVSYNAIDRALANPVEREERRGRVHPTRGRRAEDHLFYFRCYPPHDRRKADRRRAGSGE